MKLFFFVFMKYLVYDKTTMLCIYFYKYIVVKVVFCFVEMDLCEELSIL